MFNLNHCNIRHLTHSCFDVQAQQWLAWIQVRTSKDLMSKAVLPDLGAVVLASVPEAIREGSGLSLCLLGWKGFGLIGYAMS